jgi:hypothetical protein
VQRPITRVAIGLVGALDCLLRSHHRDDGVDGGVDAVDLLDVRDHDFAGRDLAFPDLAGKRFGGGEDDLSGRHGIPFLRRVSISQTVPGCRREKG